MYRILHPFERDILTREGPIFKYPLTIGYILYLYLDKTRDIQSNIAFALVQGQRAIFERRS